MYTNTNFKTKKAFKDAVKAGQKVTLYNLFGNTPLNGSASVEGPHYPKPHTWYANVQVTDGIVTKVS